MSGRLREIRTQLDGWTDPDTPVAAEFPYSGGQGEFFFYNVVFLATCAFEALFLTALGLMTVHKWNWANLVVIGLAVMWTGLVVFIWFPMRRLWRRQRRSMAARRGLIEALPGSERRRLTRLRWSSVIALVAAAGLGILSGLTFGTPRSPFAMAIRQADTGLFRLSYLRSCSDPLSRAVATAKGPVIPLAGTWELNKAVEYTFQARQLISTPTFPISAGSSPGTAARCIRLTSLDMPPLVASYPVRPTTAADPRDKSKQIVNFTGAPMLTSRDGRHWDNIDWRQQGAPNTRLSTSVPRTRQILSRAALGLAIVALVTAPVAWWRYVRLRPKLKG